MKFADLVNGTSVFIDSNTFVYAFAPHAQFGPSCEQFLERVEHQEVVGFASTSDLSDVAHRLMSLEACAVFGWPYTGIAQRMKRHPAEVQQLSRYRQAINAILAIGLHVIAPQSRHIQAATMVSQQFGLLSNDGLVVALMQENGLTHIASHDADFDRVPGISRYTPV